MQFTHGKVQEDGNRITSESGDFFAVRTAVGWAVYFTGQTHTGQLIGDVIEGKFIVSPACHVKIDIDNDAVALVCILLHCQLEDDRRGSTTDKLHTDNQ